MMHPPFARHDPRSLERTFSHNEGRRFDRSPGSRVMHLERGPSFYAIRPNLQRNPDFRSYDVMPGKGAQFPESSLSPERPRPFVSHEPVRPQQVSSYDHVVTESPFRASHYVSQSQFHPTHRFGIPGSPKTPKTPRTPKTPKGKLRSSGYFFEDSDDEGLPKKGDDLKKKKKIRFDTDNLRDSMRIYDGDTRRGEYDRKGNFLDESLREGTNLPLAPSSKVNDTKESFDENYSADRTFIPVSELDSVIAEHLPDKKSSPIDFGIPTCSLEQRLSPIDKIPDCSSSPTPATFKERSKSPVEDKRSIYERRRSPLREMSPVAIDQSKSPENPQLETLAENNKVCMDSPNEISERGRSRSPKYGKGCPTSPKFDKSSPLPLSENDSQDTKVSNVDNDSCSPRNVEPRKQSREFSPLPSSASPTRAQDPTVSPSPRQASPYSLPTNDTVSFERERSNSPSAQMLAPQPMPRVSRHSYDASTSPSREPNLERPRSSCDDRQPYGIPSSQACDSSDAQQATYGRNSPYNESHSEQRNITYVDRATSPLLPGQIYESFGGSVRIQDGQPGMFSSYHSNKGLYPYTPDRGARVSPIPAYYDTERTQVAADAGIEPRSGFETETSASIHKNENITSPRTRSSFSRSPDPRQLPSADEVRRFSGQLQETQNADRRRSDTKQNSLDDKMQESINKGLYIPRSPRRTPSPNYMFSQEERRPSARQVHRDTSPRMSSPIPLQKDAMITSDFPHPVPRLRNLSPRPQDDIIHANQIISDTTIDEGSQGNCEELTKINSDLESRDKSPSLFSPRLISPSNAEKRISPKPIAGRERSKSPITSPRRSMSPLPSFDDESSAVTDVHKVTEGQDTKFEAKTSLSGSSDQCTERRDSDIRDNDTSGRSPSRNQGGLDIINNRSRDHSPSNPEETSGRKTSAHDLKQDTSATVLIDKPSSPRPQGQPSSPRPVQDSSHYAPSDRDRTQIHGIDRDSYSMHGTDRNVSPMPQYERNVSPRPDAINRNTSPRPDSINRSVFHGHIDDRGTSPMPNSRGSLHPMPTIDQSSLSNKTEDPSYVSNSYRGLSPMPAHDRGISPVAGHDRGTSPLPIRDGRITSERAAQGYSPRPEYDRGTSPRPGSERGVYPMPLDDRHGRGLYPRERIDGGQFPRQGSTLLPPGYDRRAYAGSPFDRGLSPIPPYDRASSLSPMPIRDGMYPYSREYSPIPPHGRDFIHSPYPRGPTSPLPGYGRGVSPIPTQDRGTSPYPQRHLSYRDRGSSPMRRDSEAVEIYPGEIRCDRATSPIPIVKTTQPKRSTLVYCDRATSPGVNPLESESTPIPNIEVRVSHMDDNGQTQG